jgi:hypothetical protein
VELVSRIRDSGQKKEGGRESIVAEKPEIPAASPPTGPQEFRSQLLTQDRDLCDTANAGSRSLWS